MPVPVVVIAEGEDLHIRMGGPDGVLVIDLVVGVIAVGVGGLRREQNGVFDSARRQRCGSEALFNVGGQLIPLVDLQRPVGAALRQGDDIALLHRGIGRDLPEEHGEGAELQHQQQNKRDQKSRAEAAGLAQGSIFIHGRAPPFRNSILPLPTPARSCVGIGKGKSVAWKLCKGDPCGRPPVLPMPESASDRKGRPYGDGETGSSHRCAHRFAMTNGR